MRWHSLTKRQVRYVARKLYPYGGLYYSFVFFGILTRISSELYINHIGKELSIFIIPIAIFVYQMAKNVWYRLIRYPIRRRRIIKNGNNISYTSVPVTNMSYDVVTTTTTDSKGNSSQQVERNNLKVQIQLGNSLRWFSPVVGSVSYWKTENYGVVVRLNYSGSIYLFTEYKF